MIASALLVAVLLSPPARADVIPRGETPAQRAERVEARQRWREEREREEKRKKDEEEAAEFARSKKQADEIESATRAADALRGEQTRRQRLEAGAAVAALGLIAAFLARRKRA